MIRLSLILLLLGSAGCDLEPLKPVVDAGPPVDAGPLLNDGHFCAMPGTIQYGSTGTYVVPGGVASAPSLSWLHLPVGFCAHYFGTIGNARQMRFAPGGELFVASPTTGTTGGGASGLGAIVIVPDDNQDGNADGPLTFLGSIASTQGLLFTKDYFYWQNDTQILRMPYVSGQRAAVGPPELMANITIYTSSLHWPKTLDEADDGTIYVANGGDQGETCDPTHPFHGGILKLDGSPGGAPVAQGLRNPIAVRCARGHNRCFAAELAKDYSAEDSGREKLLPIHDGDDWGYPCCASQNLPYTDVMPVPDCSGVTPESTSFVIGNTPFSFDFEAGAWPAPWKTNVFVPLHGVAGSWEGARIISVTMDPTSGLPVQSSDLPGTNPGGFQDFATGWDDKTQKHGRPAAVTFAPDGRMFVANDTNGVILWITPFDT
jgi:glucose/arabinose dehydrogenase